MITVSHFYDGPMGSSSETDMSVSAWRVDQGKGNYTAKPLAVRRWRIFAVRQAKRIARELGETEIKVYGILGDSKVVEV